MSRVDRLLDEAEKLDPAERSELVERLLEGMPSEVDPDVENAWKEEVRARLARVRSGETQLIPWDETEGRLLAR